MKLLRIPEAKKFKRERVEFPELDAYCWVRELSASEVTELGINVANAGITENNMLENTDTLTAMFPQIVAATACDDDGNAILTVEQIRGLPAQFSNFILAVAITSLTLSGLVTPDTEKESEKNA